KQMFPKHVRAFINDTAVKLKGDDNHWSVDFGAKMPPLPFDLEVSAPGYQSAVLHFEHVDDLKNPSPLRLDREHGDIAFRPSDTTLLLLKDGYLPRELKIALNANRILKKEISLAQAAPLYQGTIRIREKNGAPVVPLSIALGPDLKSGTMTQAGRHGNFVVKF